MDRAALDGVAERLGLGWAAERGSHRARSSFCKTRVLHVTCRIAAGLPSLRDPLTVALLLDYLARVCEKKGWRLVEYSIQTNHLHLICEAEDQDALSRAMNGLMSGLARVLNKHWGRRGKGKVFEDRYHAESIDNPTQTGCLAAPHRRDRPFTPTPPGRAIAMRRGSKICPDSEQEPRAGAPSPDRRAT